MTAFNNSLLAILFVFTSILLSACGSGHDHGPTPNGLELVVNGEVVAIQEGTTISYTHGNSVSVPHGEALEVRVQFFLEDGERYNYTTDDGYSLRFNISNTDVLQVTHPINNDEWLIHMRGNATGSSTINFELWHVDHSDFDSRNFNVTVTE